MHNRRAACAQHKRADLVVELIVSPYLLLADAHLLCVLCSQLASVLLGRRQFRLVLLTLVRRLAAVAATHDDKQGGGGEREKNTKRRGGRGSETRRGQG